MTAGDQQGVLPQGVSPLIPCCVKREGRKDRPGCPVSGRQFTAAHSIPPGKAADPGCRQKEQGSDGITGRDFVFKRDLAGSG